MEPTLRPRQACTPIMLAALAAWLPPAYGQATATATLPAVEVLGTTPIAGTVLPKDQIAANVQSVRSVELDDANGLDLVSFMNRRLGSVHINDVQNNPFQPDVNYRGFTASPLLGTPQGLSVFVDGVRMNQPFGDVVSWDLIPRNAIAGMALMPGSNPLFGLNTLGGALAVTTKSGLTHPGTSVQGLAGSYGRAAIEFETGGRRASGLDWFVAGTRFHDGGWRQASPTDVSQLFGKLGWRSADTRVALSMALADSHMTGNGLQEIRLLDRDRSSIYTLPDVTRNRSLLLNLEASRQLGPALSVTGNAYWRRVTTSTLNGDVNEHSLDQSVYQPSAAEITALARAGYSGFSVSGANAANTPFPKWRCIANALRNDEPAEKCTGVLNTTQTVQSNAGFSAQLNWDGSLGSLRHRAVGGLAFDASRARFRQGSELGYINPDRTITGVGAFGDGGVTGGDIDGVPYDTRVDLTAHTRTWSLFTADTLTLGRDAHLTLAGRYNRTVVSSRDGIASGPGSLDGDLVLARFNPAVGLTWALGRAVTVYAAYNEGSRAPSAIELGCADPANPCKLPNAMAGDPPLKQVVTKTVEAGVRGRLGSAASWNVGVFRADNHDDLLFVADNQVGFGYFKNFGRTRRQGLEAGIAVRTDKALTVGASYTWLDATYRSAETLNGSANSSNDQAVANLPGVDGTIAIRPGDRIPLVPRHLLKLYADWRIDAAWSLSADMTAIGDSLARGNENNRHQAAAPYYLGDGRTPGYVLTNLGLAFRPTPQWKLFVQVNNLFDTRYASASQLGTTAFDASGNVVARPYPANANGDRPLQSSTFLAPGAPRTAWLGARYAFW